MCNCAYRPSPRPVSIYASKFAYYAFWYRVYFPNFFAYYACFIIICFLDMHYADHVFILIVCIFAYYFLKMIMIVPKEVKERRNCITKTSKKVLHNVKISI